MDSGVQVCCNGVIYEERFCERDGEGYGDVFMGSKKMKFQNKRVRERWIVVCQYVAWSSSYRAKYITRLELVEGKFSKLGKVFDKVSDFISEILVFSQKKKV